MERSILRELCSWSRSLTKRSLWKRQEPRGCTHLCTCSQNRGDRQRSNWSRPEWTAADGSVPAKMACAKPYADVRADRLSQWDQFVLSVSLRDARTRAAREQTGVCLNATWSAASGGIPVVYFCPQTRGGSDEARRELWHGASHDGDDHPVGLHFSSDSESKVETERGAACPACVKDCQCINTHSWVQVD